MVDSSFGTAKLNLTLDTSEYSVALERAKQQQTGLGDAAAQEAAKMTRAQRQVINTLERQTATAGLTRQEMVAYNIATKTTGETQAALLNRLRANTAEIDKQGVAARKTTKELNQYGISAAQQAAALRGVPAQVTDIFVSLQGGQNPLTVLLQQGGQLKDMFGGIVPAARALGGAIGGLINIYTATAAVVGVVGYAYLSAEGRANDFNRALLLTGSSSKTTADDLNNMALQLDNLSGVTSRQAASALTQVVANGRIAASQYKLVTEAAVLMEDAVGKAVDETVSEYADLARDPVNAILRLNESEGFLTQSVYQRIRALQESGDIEAAAALATETRAASQIERAKEVVESLGLVSGAWHSIKENTGEAWDEAVNYFGALDKEAKEAAGTLSRLWAALKSGPSMPWTVQAALNPGMVGTGTGGAAANPVDPKVNSAVQKQLDSLLAGNKSREERQALEEQQIVNLYKQLGISKEDARVQEALATSQKRYKESLPKGASTASAQRSLANAEAQATLQVIKNSEEAQRSEIANTTRVLSAQYSARLVSASGYYDQQRQLVQRDFAAQEESLTKQIEYLQTRALSGRDAVDVARQITELETRLSKVRADGATQLAILGIQETDVAGKRKRAIDGYKESLQTANEAAQQTANAQLARIILGEQEAERQERIAAVLADTAEKQRQLSREYAESNDTEMYQEKLAELKAFTDEQLRIVQGMYDSMRAAESDWLNGFKGGIADWTSGAANVAEQVNAITKRSLDGTVDMLTDFAMTGKLTWRNLLADIGEEIVRFMMKQAVLQFVQMFGGMLRGGVGPVQREAIPLTLNANGNAYQSPSLSAYSGTVVNQPTPFYFAKGAGVMGEAGWEGIFPLARGSDGKLGVKASGGGAGGDVYVTTQVTVNTDGSVNTSTQTAGGQAAMYRELGDMMSSVAQQAINKALMPNGAIWKARMS